MLQPAGWSETESVDDVAQMNPVMFVRRPLAVRVAWSLALAMIGAAVEQILSIVGGPANPPEREGDIRAAGIFFGVFLLARTVVWVGLIARQQWRPIQHVVMINRDWEWRLALQAEGLGNPGVLYRNSDIFRGSGPASPSSKDHLLVVRSWGRRLLIATADGRHLWQLVSTRRQEDCFSEAEL